MLTFIGFFLPSRVCLDDIHIGKLYGAFVLDHMLTGFDIVPQNS